MKRFTKDEIAQRVARDIPEGAYVNLGIGLPTLVANHLDPAKEILLHSENGILGMGPAPQPGEEDEELINAGKQPVTLLTGGAYFHHADSFAMMRGGHLDICVLGAFQVSRHGDLANWHTGAPDAIQLAIGISEALVNTALGLSTAIIGILLYNYFATRVDNFQSAIEETSFEIMDLLRQTTSKVS